MYTKRSRRHDGRQRHRKMCVGASDHRIQGPSDNRSGGRPLAIYILIGSSDHRSMCVGASDHRTIGMGECIGERYIPMGSSDQRSIGPSRTNWAPSPGGMLNARSGGPGKCGTNMREPPEDSGRRGMQCCAGRRGRFIFAWQTQDCAVLRKERFPWHAVRGAEAIFEMAAAT